MADMIKQIGGFEKYAANVKERLDNLSELVEPKIISETDEHGNPVTKQLPDLAQRVANLENALGVDPSTSQSSEESDLTERIAALEAKVGTSDSTGALADEIEDLKSNLWNSTGKYFKTEYTTNNGSVARIMNEPSGGGSYVVNKGENISAYVGVNISGNGDLVDAQIYAKDSTTNKGTRLNVSATKGLFYLKGGTNTGFSEADREIAVLADIKELEDKIPTISSGMLEIDENGDLMPLA